MSDRERAEGAAQDAPGTVLPDPEAYRRALEAVPRGQPVVMINLLRFRPEAAYPAEMEGLGGSGEKAYGRYAAAVGPLLRKAGGEVLLEGAAHGALIAPPGEHWHAFLVVRYPSVEAFSGMVQSEAYHQVAVHRTAALADSRLVPTTAGSFTSPALEDPAPGDLT